MRMMSISLRWARRIFKAIRGMWRKKSTRTLLIICIAAIAAYMLYAYAM